VGAVEAPLSASAVNHRLRALENFFTVMDGQARRIPSARSTSARSRSSAEGADVRARLRGPVLHAGSHGAEEGRHARTGSLSRIRFETMLVTGLTPKQLGQIAADAVDWTVPSLRAAAALKGRRHGGSAPAAAARAVADAGRRAGAEAVLRRSARTGRSRRRRSAVR
jgi:hypothetical protein